MARVEKRRKPQPTIETPLQALMRDHLRALQVKNYSEFTLRGREGHIGFFIACRCLQPVLVRRRGAAVRPAESARQQRAGLPVRVRRGRGARR
jgi:hypothetical protein